MGLSAFAALVAIALAFIAQSPRLLSRLSLTGQRLDLRAKSFTGYGLALLLLAMGFFLAGVPLDRSGNAEVAEVTSTPDSDAVGGGIETTEEAADESAGGQSGAMVGLPTQASGGASGAMSGLITPQATLDPSIVISATQAAATAESALPPDAADTPQPTASPTRVPTATPTPEPSPTPTATPILLPTAHINDATSTLPVRRLPGGPVLVVLVRGDAVIPLTGHAFYDGDLWREIQTVDGVIGWMPDEFLDYGSSGDG